jgi:hypothetical protein
MAYLVAMIIADARFVGFLLVTRYEHARGARFVEGYRSALDARARKIEFIARHVDWGELIAHTSRTYLEEAAHEIATRSLMLVRSFERFLTRAVRVLRTRKLDRLPQETTVVPSKGALNVERLKHGLNSKHVPVQDVVGEVEI